MTAAQRRRRWPRFVIPLAVVAVFWVASIAAHYYQQPNPFDSGTLSPTGTGRHGSSQLAQRLGAQGVEVQRVTSTRDALAEASLGDATIFVPISDLLDGSLVLGLAGMPGNHRVVLAAPGPFGRLWSLAPAALAEDRWATTTAAPECSAGYATDAGVASVHRDRYGVPEGWAQYSDVALTAYCYGGSLVEFTAPDEGLQVIWVGATDPFRNDRIFEGGNGALATALLGGDRRVIWLDVHSSEIRVPLPRLGLPEYGRPDRGREDSGDSLFDAFPPQLWAALVLLLGAALLFAIARARRLGPPVAEPLPVLVPAAETTLGRGRLYRRIRARGASLAALRSAAITRLARTVAPLTPRLDRRVAAPGPERDAFIADVASRAGIDEATVTSVLFGDPPEDDAALIRAAADLDRLLAIVSNSTHRAGGSP